MIKYVVSAKMTHEVFDYAAEVMREIGYDDIEKITAEIKLGIIELERRPTEEELEEIKKVFLRQKKKIEELVGMKMIDIILREVVDDESS